MNPRTIILLAAALAFAPLLLAQSDPPPPATATFVAAGVNAGDTWTEQASYGSSFTITIDDSWRDVSGRIPQPTTTVSISRTKVVKVTSARENDTITGMEVTYTAASAGGTPISSVVGKTYVLVINGNNVGSVTYAGTTTATPTGEEVAFVTADNAHFGQIRAMNKTLGGKTVAVGQNVRAFDPDDLINTADGMSVRNFVMTLRSVDAGGQTATFDVTMELVGRMKKGKGQNDPDTPFDLSDALEMTLGGSLTVRTTTSRITSLSISGPTTLRGRKLASGKAGKHDQVKMDGSGNASIDVSYTY
ncbi:MAG TPA: hypothetical protein VNL91_03295 [Thermoanaerobaculia bacterium]|nr:hypothetical protein [Thermoanaerobaculia bacterium]